jgi:putative glutamine amidotransferase
VSGPRPVIGISAYREPLRVREWEVPAAVLPHTYAKAIFAAGGQPVLLPPLPRNAARLLDALDGLVLSGGGDISPRVYGKRADPAALLDVNNDRDGSEIALVEAARERQMPIFGICRGLQLINVAFGGTLVEHLPDRVGHDGHKLTPGEFTAHEVALEPGSRIQALLGERTSVMSHHHQAVDRVARGIEVSGRAEDGTVEALELPQGAFALAVQWHPEEGGGAPLFEALTEAAVSYREVGRG